jgi:hypothetical protein
MRRARITNATKSAIELPQEERPEQPASGVKASIRVATSSRQRKF